MACREGNAKGKSGEPQKNALGVTGSELHLFRDHSSSNVENVLEVVQAAGWEISHWRVMLSRNDGSRGKDSKRESQGALSGAVAWMDVEGHGFLYTEVTAKHLSCEWLDRMQVGEQVCGEEAGAGVSRMH